MCKRHTSLHARNTNPNLLALLRLSGPSWYLLASQGQTGTFMKKLLWPRSCAKYFPLHSIFELLHVLYVLKTIALIL